VQLFTREHNRLSLSQSGERLLVYADRMLGLSDEAMKAIAGSRAFRRPASRRAREHRGEPACRRFSPRITRRIRMSASS
jgi:DNA-binding transcriptional LysR family regulator